LTRSDLTIRKYIGGLLKHLHKGGRPRVWSVIITLFGDAVVPRGGVISLTSIQEIFAHMQFEENAVRTAMSRLTKENWLIRTKEGRQSFYKLAPQGLGKFETATKRIYTKSTQDWSGEFDLVLMKSADARSRNTQKKQMLALGYGSPVADVYIKPGANELPLPADMNVISRLTCQAGEQNLLQGLVSESWHMDELHAGYEAVIRMYEPVFDMLAIVEDLAPMDALVLRLLLIHDWRRVVLKDVELPDGLKPDNWPGERACDIVGALYHKLLESSEIQLDTCYASANSMLPEPKQTFYERFKIL